MSTIDIAEPAREVERAAELFARGEHGMERAQAISSLRVAIELILAIVPHSSRYEAERAVVEEFAITLAAKLGHISDAAEILHQAREMLAEEFPVGN